MTQADPADLSNKILVPYRLFKPGIEVITDRCCPDDIVYFIDHDGHVHILDYRGRLIDLPVPPSDLDGSEDDYD